ncbi:MAG: metalloregulator ArsR/SmtB family transcription factor [Rhizonema sp. PD37]|nr:metalloregulator ArsR/SmtB family transcription factor [Rhizonema sp. PD37]
MPKVSPTALTQIANYFKVLSEVSRLQVLCCLQSGRKNVTEIIQETGLGQANVSKHLRILAQSGIVIRQPQGVSVFYHVADSRIFEICEQVCGHLSIRLQEQSQELKQFEARSER